MIVCVISSVSFLSFALEKCSHVRAHHLFLESLTTQFVAIRCRSFLNIEFNLCTHDYTTALMGGDISRDSLKPHGIFYVETKGESPYVISNHRSFHGTKLIYLPERSESTEPNESTEPKNPTQLNDQTEVNKIK